MKSTIAQLQTIAGILRGFQNTEPEAPRLFRDYLDMVPVKELRTLESEHEDAIAAADKEFDAKRDEAEKFEAQLEEATKNYHASLDKLDAEASASHATINSLNDQIAAMSERSDNSFPGSTGAASPGDHAMIEALQSSLFMERAKVKQLEARLALPAAAAEPVKPLDKKRDATPARKATPTDPKAKAEPALATAPPVLTLNPERGGIELRFNGKPDDTTLAALQSHKWRWAPRQPGTPWYAKHTEEQYLFAQSLATGSAYTPMPEDPTPEPEAAAPAAMPAPEPVVWPEAAIPQDAPAPRRRIIMPEF